MMKKPVILLDMDEVLCEFTRTFLIVSGIGLENYEKIQNYNMLKWNIGTPGADVIDAFHKHCTAAFYRTIPTVFGAELGVSQLKGLGDIVVVTSTPDLSDNQNVVKAKKEWLMEECGGVLADAPFISTAHKHLVSGDILIDDHADNVESFVSTGRKAVLFSRPWNKEAAIRKHPNVRVAESWYELPSLVSELLSKKICHPEPDMGQLSHPLVHELMQGVALVFTHGRVKYPNQHWHDVPPEKTKQSLLRHVTELVNGDLVNEKDWGLPVEYHIVARAMMHYVGRMKGNM